MPEETGTPAPENQEAPEKTYTQEEVNKMIGARLDRERKKYADYEALKADAEAYRQAQEAQKSELQKAQEKLAKLEAEIKARDEKAARDALVAKVMDEKGIDHKYAPLLTGNDEESLAAQAELIGSIPNNSFQPSYNERRKPADSAGTVTDQFGDWMAENFVF